MADGPAAPTRRVTGPVDLDDPACSPSTFVLQNPEATGPCYGPLTDNEAARGQIINTPPALSADGRTVAVLTAAGQRPTIAPGAWTDLFVTDMSPGVSRKAGTLELTREGDPGDSSVSAPIEAVAISADGRTIAITTNRISFVLPTLRPIGPRRTFPSVRDLFVIDLPTRTIERALRSIDGGDANGDVDRAVSVSADGGRVAFVATASNLVVGDANERPDAFVITRQLEPGQEPPRPPPPAGPGVVEELPPPEPAPRRLSVSAARRADGSVSLRVAVPGPGRLAAAARASRRVKGRTRTSTVARASAKPRRAGRLTMTLRPSAAVRARLRRGERVRATATVRYVPARGRAVSRTVRVTFALARGTRQGR